MEIEKYKQKIIITTTLIFYSVGVTLADLAQQSVLSI